MPEHFLVPTKRIQVTRLATAAVNHKINDESLGGFTCIGCPVSFICAIVCSRHDRRHPYEARAVNATVRAAIQSQLWVQNE
jgi:hypothetical protein